MTGMVLAVFIGIHQKSSISLLGRDAAFLVSSLGSVLYKKTAVAAVFRDGDFELIVFLIGKIIEASMPTPW